jgi:hypothetical protein
LYQAPIDINQSNTLATFTGNIATYHTYLAQAVTWDAPSLAQDGTVEVVAVTLIFRPTDAVVPNSIWGLYITDTTAAFLLFAGQFDGPPLPMNSTLNQILVTVRYRPATGSIAVQIN